MRRALAAIAFLAFAGLASAQDADPVAEMIRKNDEMRARQAASMERAQVKTMTPLQAYGVSSPLPNAAGKAGGAPQDAKQPDEGGVPWFVWVLGGAVIAVVVLMRLAGSPKPVVQQDRYRGPR